ncbi:hypothetical protein BAE44_0023864 [Dichanthelium oligosanthes]|uniref:Remorin C-terminal domain-containing protein n=1 Tax=Dichanthelium oligosanthes TaxID=888268 RepID=A0A1E5UQG8_9POAL|nr:hypothetical protein BAE44_0023864 [Dichanthelium oligosanthes]
MSAEAKDAGTSAPAKDVAEERAAVPAPEESKALVVVENVPTIIVLPGDEKPAATGGSHERDAFLTRVATDKTTSLIRALHEPQNFCSRRATRRMASVAAWENTKVAQMEAELKKMHEQLEMKNAEQAEKLKNSAAAAHRAAEEKRAAAVARRGEEVIRAEEAAAGYRARGQAPTRPFGLGLFGRG